MKLPENSGADYAPTPMGQHTAILTRLIDLGTQPGSSKYPDPKRKVLFGWEIPEHRIEFERDGEKVSGPVMHFERWTLSSGQKSIMRQRLEAWRGVPFSDADFGNFDLQTLLGVPALMQITHDPKDGTVYANLTAIMKLPGVKRESWPQPEGELIYVSLEQGEFDRTAFDKLSDRLKEKISTSPEYRSLMGETLPDMPPAEPELEDEIPF